MLRATMTVTVLLGGLTLSWATAHATAAEPDPFDQSTLPIEQLPSDPAAIKIVLIAGGPSTSKSGEHEWLAGSAILWKLLRQTPGVHPVLVRDGWPKNADTLRGARAVVFYGDGGGKQVHLSRERLDQLDELAAAGVGIVHLHQVIDYPADAGARVLPWIGGAWDKEIGCRGHWVAECRNFPEHAITRGVGPFELDDGWIFNIRFVGEQKGVTPLLSLVPPEKLRTTADARRHPGRAEIMAWAFDRESVGGKGRAFVFVGGHLHSSWGKPELRRFVVNGILWSAGLEIPTDGAKVELAPAELRLHLDRKPTPKPPSKKAK